MSSQPEPLSPDWWEDVMGSMAELRVHVRRLNQRYRELGAPHGDNQEGLEAWIAEVKARGKNKEQ